MSQKYLKLKSQISENQLNLPYFDLKIARLGALHYLLTGMANVSILSRKCDDSCTFFLACGQLIFRVP